MLSLTLDTSRSTAPIEILCLGAHCDDIEIGCGGTLLEFEKLQRNRRSVSVHCVVFSANPVREKETREALGALLKPFPHTTIEIQNFRNSFFPYIAVEIKEYFEALKLRINPALVFTHHREDRHQDHRLISDLTWNAFRDHYILEYEIPKYDGDLGHPSTFVEVSSDNVRRKIDILYECFKSQHSHRWFTKDIFQSLMRLRGVECNAGSGFAEAFYSRKTVLGF